MLALLRPMTRKLKLFYYQRLLSSTQICDYHLEDCSYNIVLDLLFTGSKGGLNIETFKKCFFAHTIGFVDLCISWELEVLKIHLNDCVLAKLE